MDRCYSQLVATEIDLNDLMRFLMEIYRFVYLFVFLLWLFALFAASAHFVFSCFCVAFIFLTVSTHFVVVAAQLRLASFCPLSLAFSSVKFFCFSVFHFSALARFH